MIFLRSTGRLAWKFLPSPGCPCPSNGLAVPPRRLPEFVTTVALGLLAALAGPLSRADAQEIPASQPPELGLPLSGGVSRSPLQVSFSLPEPAAAGSVKLTFTAGATERILVLAGSEETAASHALVLDLANPKTSPKVASGSSIPDGTYAVKLSYRNTAGGAEASVSADPVVLDTKSPTLTLNGSPAMNVPLNGTFADPGATATDTASGPVSIVASGTVNPAVAGRYDLTYLATDGAGNVASAARRIYVGNVPGFLDTSLRTPFSAESVTTFGPRAMIVQPDGKIIIGGYFQSVDGLVRPGLARLNADGSVDPSFNPGIVNGMVYCLALQPDGKILVGGEFDAINGQTRRGFARLLSDGSVESLASFPVGTGVSGMVYSLMVQPDGRILLGGFFSTVNGQPRKGIARLNADGTVEGLDTFKIGAGVTSSGDLGYVYSVALQPDGKILLVGAFTKVNTTSRAGIARLNSDGSVDGGFAAGTANDLMRAVVVQPDGKILVGGKFFSFASQARRGLVRLTSTGALDPSFVPVGFSSGGDVNSLILQADGKIVFSRTSIGLEVARANPDGSRDTTFDPGAGFAFTTAPTGTFLYGNGTTGSTPHLPIALQPDGRILAAGPFESFDQNLQKGLVRLLNDPASATLRVANDGTAEWARGGAAPAVSVATFDLSTDGGANWTSLGTGQWISGAWRISDQDLPPVGTVRARARISGSFCSNSSSPIEASAAYDIRSAPQVATSSGSMVSTTRVQMSGGVLPGGFQTTVQFEYGLTSDYGQSVTVASIQGTSVKTVGAAVDALLPHRLYHFRVVATNGFGTALGADQTVMTGNTLPVALDGAATITTGDQTAVDLPFTSPDADGDAVTLVSVTPGNGAPFTVGATAGKTVALSCVANGVGSFPLTYQVSDGFGGLVTKTLTITVLDNDAPVLTMHGANPALLEVGDAFTDPGATVVDNVTASLPIVISGQVDTATPGTYVIQYRATDAAGNGAVKNRTVNVVATPHSTWRQAAFGGEAGNPEIAGDRVDPNGNGIDNLLEYALGGDPLAKSGDREILPKVTADGTRHLVLSFARCVAYRDLSLVVQGADELDGPWIDLACSEQGNGFVALVEGVEITESGSGEKRAVSIRDAYAAGEVGHPRRFLRLSVQR